MLDVTVFPDPTFTIPNELSPIVILEPAFALICCPEPTA